VPKLCPTSAVECSPYTSALGGIVEGKMKLLRLNVSEHVAQRGSHDFRDCSQPRVPMVGELGEQADSTQPFQARTTMKGLPSRGPG